MEFSLNPQMHALVEKQLGRMERAERQIWANPETGYKEWKTHAFLKAEFEQLGYDLVEAGDIPGFYADLATGRPGPTVVLMGEMDSVICPTHPSADPATGAVHACGHHAQLAALLGVAAALKEPGALEGLCGTIRLMAVPAEELLELEFREGLRKQGTIRYFGGKPEFMARGYFDDVDLCLMLHTGDGKGRFYLSPGQNGCINKTITYHGVAAHAGGAPHLGVNALYAQTLGINAINAIRETFEDMQHIRVHPITTTKPGAVNVIPDTAVMESYVRGASVEAIEKANKRVNRALAGAAVSMGARLSIQDRPGYSPVYNDQNMYDLSRAVMAQLVGEENVLEDGPMQWGTGCTDMGDISCVFPAIHPSGSGATGTGHGMDYEIADTHSACTLAAKYLFFMAAALLQNGGAEAQHILANKQTRFASIGEYLQFMDGLTADIDAVAYEGDGKIRVEL